MQSVLYPFSKQLMHGTNVVCTQLTSCSAVLPIWRRLLTCKGMLGVTGKAQADEFDEEAGGWKRQGKGRRRAVTRGQTTVQVRTVSHFHS